MSITIQRSIINGGTFVSTGDNDASSSNNQSKGFKILYEKIAADAFHNSGERFDAPKCHPKTRVAVLEDIMRWIQNLADSKDILWLNGSAGAGKSAIAQTIAEMCAKLGLLIASFFFISSSSSRNNEKRLIASIAYQLALAIPGTRPFIESTVQFDPSIFDKSLETQVETLIILPLQKARSAVTPAIAEKWPRLILIDGLDECNGHSIQCSIIRALSTAILCHRVPLILFVASRPEPHIRNIFNAFDIFHASHHIVLDSSYHPDADIKELLLSRFKEVKENHPLATIIPESWPPAEIIDRLVQKSSGQFIYASTVMKYLDSPQHRPMERLDIIIGLIPVGCDAPYKQLDTLYNHIFSCVKNIAGALQVIGFLLFERNSRPTPEFLECLFGLRQGDVHLCLFELHSILDIPPPTVNNNPIRILHASLGDFLVDKLRSGRYYLDEVMVHTDIAQRCLPRVSTFIYEQQSSTIDDIATPYSILSFAYHCSRASTTFIDLKKNLMQSNLQEWFRQFPPLSDSSYLDLLLFFEWSEKADTSGRLFSCVRYFWDQCILAGLNKYAFGDNGVDLAVILTFPRHWTLLWLELIGVPEYPDVLQSYFVLEPTSTREREAHCKLFMDFFRDRNRSGKYHVNPNNYAWTALRCIRVMFNLKRHSMTFDPQPFIAHIKKSAPRTELAASKAEITFHLALESIAILLSMASPLNALYFVLRDHQLQARRTPTNSAVELESLTILKSAIETYLEEYESNLLLNFVLSTQDSFLSNVM